MIKETIDTTLQLMQSQAIELQRVHCSAPIEILEKLKEYLYIALNSVYKEDYQLKINMVTWFVCSALNIDIKNKIPFSQFCNVVLTTSPEDERLTHLVITARRVYCELITILVKQNPITPSIVALPSDQCVHRIWVGGKASEDQLVFMAAANLTVAKNMSFSQPVFYLWTDNSAMLHQKSIGTLARFNLRDVCSLYVVDRSHSDFKLINELIDYSRLLIKFREFAIASNLLRMIVLYKYGGFYLDANWVQSIFPIDPSAFPAKPGSPLFSQDKSKDVEFSEVLESNGMPNIRCYDFDFLSYQSPYLGFFKIDKLPSASLCLANTNKSLAYVKTKFNPTIRTVLENSKVYLDNRSEHNISKILINYREFKHKKLRDSFVRNEAYRTSSDDLKFIVSLSSLPFEHALVQTSYFDFYIDYDGIYAECADQPMLSIRMTPSGPYRFVSNIGLANKYSNSWKRLDLKDRQNAEWP
ncbi:glycosyltransferase [Pelagibaculum spongiae]|uniref:GT44 domain-containing protein n=1 Tax=Pelagibaculum spongiae TaxID=2080658 RepID=A0A2V1H376_9GAMM|nr:glycosyltransferase [Pelagibaculum spongiae]PVZ69757.1 hypothetical protein DC094_10695 [Pelagibaculum spongiae]